MTVRSDVRMDWNASPRILTVLAPSTSITIQDLHDTLVTLEARSLTMVYERTIITEGKQQLNAAATKLVGLTASLQNVLVAFEARPGPTYVQVEVADGNLVAFNDLGAVQESGVSPSAFTQVLVEQDTSAALIQLAELQLKVDELWAIQGLDQIRNLIVTATSRDAGVDISQTVTEAPAGTVTVSRDP